MPNTSEVSIDIAAGAAKVFEALTNSSALEQWFAEHADVDREANRFDFWGRNTYGNPSREDGRGRILEWTDGAELSFESRVRGIACVTRLFVVPTPGGSRVTTQQEYQPEDGNDLNLDGAWCLLLQNLRSWVETGKVVWRPDYSKVPRGELRFAVDAQASSATVFNALIDPAQLSRWMMAESPTVAPEIGGTYDLGWPEGDGRPLKILDIAQDSRLVYSWDDAKATGTVVTWELDGSRGATRISLVHSGFDESHPLDDYYGGWADFLLRLVGLCEQGPRWTAPAWSAIRTATEPRQ